MIILLTLFFSMYNNQNIDEVYEYVNYYSSGESYQIVFDIKRGKVSSGDSYSHEPFTNCSTIKFRCVKIGETIIFAPEDIKFSGNFDSPFGKYAVYKSNGALPFNKKIKYFVIEYSNKNKKSLSVLYNQNIGVIALIDPANSEVSKHSWLFSECGLLSSKNCKTEND